MPISLATTFTFNKTSDLSFGFVLAISDTIGNLAYDNISDRIYFATDGGISWGVYDRTTNTSTSLDGTDVGNWIGLSGGIFEEIAFDSKNNGVYIVGGGGGPELFGYYEKATNITHDLRATDENNFITVAGGEIISVAYDNKNDGAYIVGFRNLFGYYNKTANITTNLNYTLVDSANSRAIAYDSKNDGVYIAGEQGTFQYYNRATNTSHDLRGTDSGNWIGENEITSLAYDSNNDGIYLVGANGIFGYYNKTKNVTEDLRSTSNFGTDSLLDVAYDKNYDKVYIGGSPPTFSFYSRKTNKTISLMDTDMGDWITNHLGFSAVVGVEYDTKNNGVYIGGFTGLGYFSLNGISTLVGTNQNVSSGNVTLIFSNVTSEGVTSVTISTSPTSTGFLLNGTYYEITTTATYSGNITISIPYDAGLPNAQANKLKIYHFDKNLSSWIDVTTSVDKTNKLVIGTVTSLSPFSVGIPSINFVGFLAPLKSDQNKDFKLGKTIPIKFQLVDNDGTFVTNAIAEIFVAKISDDGLIGTEQEGVSESNSENIFRYDSTDNQYIFNLKTEDLSTGKWRIRVELDDGTSHIVTISLS